MAEIIRQAKFREDGTITDVPAVNAEAPQLEKQGDIFQWERDKKNLEQLDAISNWNP